MQITLGVDGHKESHTISAINQVGRFLDELAIPNDSTGYQQAYRWACQLGTQRTWGIENSGHFARGFAQYLLTQGETVLEVSPHLTGRKRNRSRDASKSDPNDALAVARVVLQEETPLPVVERENQTTLVKLLVEQRDNLVGERTRLFNQLHAQLTEVEPHYKEQIGQLIQGDALQRCKTYPLPDDDPINETRVVIIRQLATLILQLNAHIDDLEKRITPLVEQIAPALLSIQGIGFLNAAQLIARVGNIDSVASASSLAHYAAIAPIRCGTAGNYHYRVNHRGDRQLNAVFHRIAQTQSAHNPLAKAYLAKKKAEGKTSKQAFRCLKRRMVDIVYAVWKSGNPYQSPVPNLAEASG